MARQCFFIDETMNPDGKGFIPALVTENEPGYARMGDPDSDGVTAPLPWRWGSTIEEAKAVVERTNRQDFGIEPDEARKIVVSSLFASNRS